MRLTQDIFIASTGIDLPAAKPMAEAVAEGLVDEAHSDLGYESIGISETVAPPDMAIAAGRQAVARSGIAADRYDLLLHGSVWFQGLDMWATASYVAGNCAGRHTFAVDVQQRSNCAMAGLQFAVSHLAAGGGKHALVTTADRFAAPAMDRWNEQANLIYGDGAGALAVSTEGGLAKVVSIVSLGDSSLEPAGRGAEEFRTAPGAELPVRIMRRLEAFATTPGAVGAWERYEATLARAVTIALEEAGVGLEDISRAVLPFIHRGGGRAENYDALGFSEKQSLWEVGRVTGHMGGADQFVGLDHLLRNRSVTPGDHVLLVGVGVGHSFTIAVVQIVDTPSW
ncbi:ketoacyl-ACP synthase III family protein [Streptomyces sp. NPDC001795]|uniref:ketoacyl-ACP synthase III family protein n=1 Tax=unclassified Streptomyces TaxID=2593676 RepID=UPI00331BF01D